MKKTASLLIVVCLFLNAALYTQASSFWDEDEYGEDEEYDEYYDDYYEIECPYCEESFDESDIIYDEDGYGMCPHCDEYLEGYEKEKLSVDVRYEYDEEGNGYDVYISASDIGADIYYTADRSTPSKNSNKYEEPFYAYGNKIVIRAIAYSGKEKSDVVNVWLSPDNEENYYQETIEDDFSREYEYYEEEAEYNTKIELTIGSKIIYINDEAVEIDAAPVIRNDRTMVPIRVIAEALGATVTWLDGEEPTVSIETAGGGHDYWITIGKKDVLVWNSFEGSDFNPYADKNPVLDSPAFIENGRTYLPVRFVSESLGAKVEWDSATHTVIITK